MTTVTYPDGSVLTSTALTKDQIQTLFQQLTAALLGIVSTDPNIWSKSRIGWLVQGQPGVQVSDDIAFVRCETADSPYSRLRDNVMTGNLDPTLINFTDVFTRVWKTVWTIYGPNSLINAKMITSGLIKVPYADGILSSSNLYVNPDIEEPQRMPELFQSQWYERVDFEVLFNEQITEVFTVGVVASVVVTTYTKDGQLTTQTVAL